jgi:hypothetical protein
VMKGQYMILTAYQRLASIKWSLRLLQNLAQPLEYERTESIRVDYLEHRPAHSIQLRYDTRAAWCSTNFTLRHVMAMNMSRPKFGSGAVDAKIFVLIFQPSYSVGHTTLLSTESGLCSYPTHLHWKCA